MSDLDLNSYQSSLQNIVKKLEVFEENIDDILVDLEDNDPIKMILSNVIHFTRSGHLSPTGIQENPEQGQDAGRSYTSTAGSVSLRTRAHSRPVPNTWPGTSKGTSSSNLT